LFEKQANGGSDADLKAFAQKQLPGLRNHLKQAQKLQARLPSTD
jgi:predicted outer membrane protein